MRYFPDLFLNADNAETDIINVVVSREVSFLTGSGTMNGRVPGTAANDFSDFRLLGNKVALFIPHIFGQQDLRIGPFGNVSLHVEQSEAVRLITSNRGGYPAAVVAVQIRGTPGGKGVDAAKPAKRINRRDFPAGNNRFQPFRTNKALTIRQAPRTAIVPRSGAGNFSRFSWTAIHKTRPPPTN